jgi:predicted anti-sigma-YlaC factor YlaD
MRSGDIIPAMKPPGRTPRLSTRHCAHIAVCALLTAGCSLNKIAVNKLGNALAESGTTFASDDDPDLVAQAVPFSLKLIESLLSSAPEHRGLLLAATSGFTQYAYAFVQQEADTLENRDLARSTALRGRARRLYLRARDYGLRGLETRHAHFAQSLRADPRAAVRVATAQDVPLLYWTAAAWGSAIAISKEMPDLVADQLLVEALIDRALELDERFESGSIHGFLASYELSRQGATGDPVARARAHFERAVLLSEGKLASPFVAFAEGASVSKQDRREFDSLLQRALAIDPNERPAWRLTNIIMQQRARWLLSRESDLFLDDPTPAGARP